MEILNLNALAPGCAAIVAGLRADLALERRLLALGFRAGRPVSLLRKAHFAGPLHVRIGSTEVMVRRSDAEAIHIQLPV